MTFLERTFQLNANGTTSDPLMKQAVAVTLATADGDHKRRVLVLATGRIHSQKWAGGTSATGPAEGLPGGVSAFRRLG